MTQPSLEKLLLLVAHSTVKKLSVELDDEIYYDLGIYGDPFFDLLDEISEEFGTDFSMLRPSDFTPGEGAEIIRPVLVLLGRKPFKSLTVAKLWRAIQSGRWE